MRDVEALVLAEQAQARSEEHYRVLAENAADVVVKTSNEGVVEWISNSVFDLLGWQPDDFVGVPGREFVHPDDLPALADVQGDMAAGVARNLQMRVQTASGGYRWVQSWVKPMTDAAGVVVGRVGSWRDIAAEHHALELLTAAEQTARSIAEHAGDFVVRTEGDGLATWVSPGVGQATGWAPEDVLGHRLDDFLLPERDDPLVGTGDGNALERDGSRVVRTVFRCADGSARWMSTVARTVTDADGSVSATVSTLRDIDDEVAAYRALAASEEVYRLLAYNASDVVVRGARRCARVGLPFHRDRTRRTPR